MGQPGADGRPVRRGVARSVLRQVSPAAPGGGNARAASGRSGDGQGSARLIRPVRACQLGRSQLGEIRCPARPLRPRLASGRGGAASGQSGAVRLCSFLRRAGPASPGPVASPAIPGRPTPGGGAGRRRRMLLRGPVLASASRSSEASRGRRGLVRPARPSPGLAGRRAHPPPPNRFRRTPAAPVLGLAPGPEANVARAHR